MIVFKPIRYGNFHTLLKLQRSSICPQNPAQKPHLSASSILSNSRSNSSFSSIFQKPFSLVSELLQNYEEKNQKKSDKTANVLSQKPAQISERIKSSGFEDGSDGECTEVEEKLRNCSDEVGSVNKVSHEGAKRHSETHFGKLRKECGKGRLCSLSSDLLNNEEIKPYDLGKERLPALFTEIEKKDPILDKQNLLIYKDRISKRKYEKRGNSELYSKKLDGEIRKKDNRSLFAVFCDRRTKEGVKLVKHVDSRLEDPLVQKEFFSAIEMFIQHLFKEGYLKKATFIPKNGVFDLSLFRSIHGRGYLKSAGYEFGKDKQEIAKWLSAGDLKKVALFGCPSLEKRTVHAAKNTRRFFKIEEHKVCRKCRLKDSCELANKQRKKDLSKLHLGYVIRLLLGLRPNQEQECLDWIHQFNIHVRDNIYGKKLRRVRSTSDHMVEHLI